MVFQYSFQNNIDQLKVWYVLYLLIKLFFSANLKILYIKRDLNNSFFFKEPYGLLICIEPGNMRKNQTYRGKGGKSISFTF